MPNHCVTILFNSLLILLSIVAVGVCVILFQSTSDPGGQSIPTQPGIIRYAANDDKALRPFVASISAQQSFNPNEIRLLSGTCLIAVLLVTAGQAVTRHVFYRKPIEKVLSTLEAYIGNEARGSSVDKLSTLVDKLIVSRKDSETFIQRISDGQLDITANFTFQDQLSESLLSMQRKLQAISEEEKKVVWLNETQAELDHIIKDEADQQVLHQKLISFIANATSSSVGVLYSFKPGEGHFVQLSSFGFYSNTKTPRTVGAGEGQLGQIAFTKSTIALDNIPLKYLVIQSGLGSCSASHIVIVPLLFKDMLYGAIELASLSKLKPHQIKWIEKAGESIGAHFFNQITTENTRRQLEDLTNKQASELVEIHALQRETNNKLEAKLAEAENERVKNEAILEGCVDAVISFNDQGKVLFCNKAMEEITRQTRSFMLSRKIAEILPVRIDSNMLSKQVVYVSASGEKTIDVRTEASFIDASGDTVDVLVTSTHVSVNGSSLFTFFIQKISVDLF